MPAAINVAECPLGYFGKWNGINSVDIFFKAPGAL